MSASFIGEIRCMAATFSPAHWAFCSGSLIAVSSNQALFSLIGTFYGGDGRTTFGLPDMRARIPMHFGNGPGLTPRPIGQRSGEETVVLTNADMPSHSHTVRASTAAADSDFPVGRVLASAPPDQNSFLYIDSQQSTSVENMSSDAISTTGAGTPHTNLMPATCVNFIIALTGDYPPRN